MTCPLNDKQSMCQKKIPFKIKHIDKNQSKRGMLL